MKDRVSTPPLIHMDWRIKLFLFNYFKEDDDRFRDSECDMVSHWFLNILFVFRKLSIEKFTIKREINFRGIITQVKRERSPRQPFILYSKHAIFYILFNHHICPSIIHSAIYLRFGSARRGECCQQSKHHRLNSSHKMKKNSSSSTVLYCRASFGRSHRKNCSLSE